MIDDWTGDFCCEGWITDDGKFIPCDREWLHGTMAMLALGGSEDTAEERAENLGWIRISSHGDQMKGEPNQAQLNTLWDYCLHQNLHYQKTLNAIKKH